MKKGYKQLVDEANSAVETIAVKDALALGGDESVTIVDIRDVRELWHEGKILGAVHAPRGMLEFWVDPDSPYHRDVFASGKKFVFYCKSGWRSALATKQLQDMGLEPVAHIDGGFGAWVEAGGPVEKVEQKKPKG
ncbi:MAG: rhodanese-like domain-containing protein [Proteobacteria bacterium]|nr:rhodanese-like domain-containing protein [Pseudomonadota bacterium]MDA1058860.1 rhodanese-like domain-containing protein [Pseudomonadota bacterium]